MVYFKNIKKRTPDRLELMRRRAQRFARLLKERAGEKWEEMIDSEEYNY